MDYEPSIQEIARRQTAKTYLRYLVWVTVAEACNIFFPRSKLQQRLLDAQPVAPAFSLTDPELLPDKAEKSARLTALWLLQVERQGLIEPSPLND